MRPTSRLRSHPRAVVHNDAGVGKDEAGIAVIAMAQALGVAAATLSHASCRIGDAADMMARGVVSHANAAARALGVVPGMAGREAALRLVAGARHRPRSRTCEEARRVLENPGWRRRIVLIDSASLIAPEDAGQIIVAGSHGALVGGSPAMALRVDGFAAAFSDAGVGADGAGITRLPALDSAASPASRSRPRPRAIRDAEVDQCDAPAPARALEHAPCLLAGLGIATGGMRRGRGGAPTSGRPFGHYPERARRPRWRG